MRQIALDTETTGLSPDTGHRIIEVACVELIDRQLTGKHYHTYLNPERLIDEEAIKVHGIQNEFLKDKPLFAAVVEEFLAFIKGAELIIHNAAFDVGFLNAEFKRCSKKLGQVSDHCQVLDSLALARGLHPGQKNNLDAVCKRYGVDIRERDLHGALIDATLLAKAYLMMTAGQNNLFGEVTEETTASVEETVQTMKTADFIELPVLYATPEELKAHEDIMNAITIK